MTDLGTSKAFAVSADGSVVAGGSYNFDETEAQAFSWTAAGGMVALPSLVGDTGGEAHSINEDGSVVGGASLSEHGFERAVRCEPYYVSPTCPARYMERISGIHCRYVKAHHSRGRRYAVEPGPEGARHPRSEGNRGQSLREAVRRHLRERLAERISTGFGVDRSSELLADSRPQR